MGRGALLCREGGSGMYPLVEESDATVELIDSLPSLLDPSSSLHPALLRRLERSFFLFDISLCFRTTKLQRGGSRDKVRSIFALKAQLEAHHVPSLPSARRPPPCPSRLKLSLLSSFKSPWDLRKLDRFFGTRRRRGFSGLERLRI